MGRWSIVKSRNETHERVSRLVIREKERSMWVVRVMCLAGSAQASATKYVIVALSSNPPGKDPRRAFPVRRGYIEKMITDAGAAGAVLRIVRTGHA